MRSNEYKEMKAKGYFTSQEVADICSISRMTVIRMEERCLLEPDIVKESGVRYYSLDRLMQLRHILILENCGLNTMQIKGLLGDTVSTPDIIPELLEDLIILVTITDADRDPFTNGKAGKIRNFEMKETHCYVKDCDEINNWEDAFSCFHEAIKEAIECKFKLVGGSPPYIEGECTEEGKLVPKKIYVPVADKKNAEGLACVPSSTVMYASWYGNPTGVADAFLAMKEEAKKRNYTPKGNCIISIMNDFHSMKDFTEDDIYLFLMLPVE